MGEILFAEAYEFCRSLERTKQAVWVDCFGRYEIIIGDYILAKQLEGLPVRTITQKNILPAAFSTMVASSSGEYEYVASIGRFKTHNAAKNICFDQDLKLITVPVPLTNDAFSTARISATSNHAPSVEGNHPVKTIIDTGMLQDVAKTLNGLGWGEFAGLYLSIIDYFLARKRPVPANLLTSIRQWMGELVCFYHADYNKFIVGLACALIFKGLVMRGNEDYQIGCGIDHLLAAVIEEKTGLAHGQAVFWGSLVALFLFPAWEKYGLETERLCYYGGQLGFVSPEFLNSIFPLEVKTLVRQAISKRPDRPSMLSLYLKG